MTSTSRTNGRNGTKTAGSLAVEKFSPVDASSNSGQQMFESAVIRARYEPDVGGVNRYKHCFRSLAPSPNDCGGSHSSLSNNGIMRSNGGGGEEGGYSGAESIDRKPKSKPVSPRARSPAIPQPSTGLSSSNNNSHQNVEGVVLPTIVGVAYGNGRAAPLVDTWRIRRHRQPSPRLSVKTPTSSAAVSRSRSPNSPSTLPAISSQMRALTSMVENALGSITASPTSGQQAVLAKHRFIPPPPAPTATAPPTGSNNSSTKVKKVTESKNTEAGKEDSGGSRFHFPKITLKPTGLGDLINRESRTEANPQLVVEVKSLAPPVANGFLPQSPSTHLKPPIRRRRREFGTQTENSATDALQTEETALNDSTESSSSPPTLQHQPGERANPKATQTDQLNAYFSRAHPLNSYEYEMEEMEQRTALLQLIDSALGETIDKMSRERTNQLIASTARKQAQVWRDVKEFMSSVLLPCSVDLANKARSVGINLEQIANIQLP